MSPTPATSRDCDRCGRSTGNLVIHQRACIGNIADRAGAHAQPESTLRAAQRFQHGVTELDVARVMAELESGTRLYLNRMGRWYAPGGRLRGLHRLSPAVHEMIRTGLVRHWRDREGDHLVPAKVHLLGTDGQSACHFVGEDMGPMRSRLTDEMTLVDCLDCERAQAHGDGRVQT